VVCISLSTHHSPLPTAFWPVEPSFYVPQQALGHFREFADRGVARQAKWESQFHAYAADFPALAAEFQRIMH